MSSQEAPHQIRYTTANVAVRQAAGNVSGHDAIVMDANANTDNGSTTWAPSITIRGYSSSETGYDPASAFNAVVAESTTTNGKITVRNASDKTKTEVEPGKTTITASNDDATAAYTSSIGVIDGLKLPWKNVESDAEHSVTANKDFPTDADHLNDAESNTVPIKGYDAEALSTNPFDYSETAGSDYSKRNDVLKSTIPSTYAVQQAISAGTDYSPWYIVPDNANNRFIIRYISNGTKDTDPRTANEYTDFVFEYDSTSHSISTYSEYHPSSP